MNGAGKTAEVQDKRAIRTSSARNRARNNKVHTAKGPRDRRIRLSADIAIQFYDVQDRLGCGRASEAVDWLISKAKGSIDKLIDTSLQQEFEHHLTNSGAQNNVVHQQSYYLTENNMSDIFSKSSTSDIGLRFLQGDLSREEDYRVSDFSNCRSIDDSMFFPCIQMTNSSENQQCFQHGSMPPFQQIDEKGQIVPRMIMFNSQLNSIKNEEHSFTSNYVPLMPSSVHTPVIDPKLNLCLPGNSTSGFSDSDQWTIFR